MPTIRKDAKKTKGSNLGNDDWAALWSKKLLLFYHVHNQGREILHLILKNTKKTRLKIEDL